ncbi:MAG: hypothetical protein ACI88G_002406, partial [Woeseiaceae bacterium]
GKVFGLNLLNLYQEVIGYTSQNTFICFAKVTRDCRNGLMGATPVSWERL